MRRLTNEWIEFEQSSENGNNLIAIKTSSVVAVQSTSKGSKIALSSGDIIDSSISYGGVMKELGVPLEKEKYKPQDLSKYFF